MAPPPAISVIARDRPVMRGHPVSQIEHRLVDVAPAPAFRRIVAFDDRMRGGVEMLGGVFVGRIIATADMTAGAADAQMQPVATDLEAFLAAKRAWRDVANAGHVGAVLCHLTFLLSQRRLCGVAAK